MKKTYISPLMVQVKIGCSKMLATSGVAGSFVNDDTDILYGGIDNDGVIGADVKEFNSIFFPEW